MRTSIVFWFVMAALAHGCKDTHPTTADATATKGCPIGLHFETLAGSVAHVGYTGRLLTGAPIGGQFSVDVVGHDGTEASCSVAEFSGPAVRTAGDATFRRCMSQPSKACSADADCPSFRCLSNPGLGGAKVCQNTGAFCSTDAQCITGAHGNEGSCKIVLGAPLPNGPPRPGCVMVGLAGVDGSPGIHGTIDLVHGTVAMDTFAIFSWVDNAGACNLCVGDDKPNDGVKHGTCVTGAASSGPEPGTGAACDAVGTNQQYPGAYSFDCVANPVFSSLALNLGPMSTDGARWKLDGSRPSSSSGRSWCGVCEDASGTTTWKPCTTAAECGGGTCVGTTADGVALPANACQNGACSYDPISGGTCTQAGSGAQPTISCLPSANDAVATSAGSSTILDDDRLNVVLGGLGCIPASRATNPADPILKGADMSIGLPGAVIATTAAQIEKLYRSTTDGGSP